MLLHYLVNALSAIVHVKLPRNTTLYSARPVSSKYPRFEPTRLQDLSYHTTSCLPDKKKICSAGERRMIDVCCGLGTVDYQHGYWSLAQKTSSVHPFETRKEENSNTTCELTILILSVSVTFSVTFVWLLYNRVTSFIHKVCLQRRQLGLQECMFYKVVQRQNHGMVADFILCSGADIYCLIRLKILKSDSNC